ncbi:hypothetical protein GCG21_15930 [Pseudactinotalea sp. HY160]|nr:hypothetical protein [Pseudactinotalea sp. HY160]
MTSAKTVLNWEYSPDAGIARIIVRGAAGQVAPATVTDGVEIVTGRALTTHATDDSGLAPGQQYSYSVFTQANSGAVSEAASITVPVVFPGAVTGVTASVDGSSRVVLAWQNPVDAQLKRITVRRVDGAVAPATIDAGRKIPLVQAQDESVTDTGLAAGMQYSYAVFATDRVGNVSPLGAGSTVTVTTPPAAPSP